MIDLARFGELRRDTSGGTQPAEPELTLVQPNDPLRQSGGTAAEPARADGNRLDLQQVQVTLSLSADVTVDDASAARVLRIG